MRVVTSWRARHVRHLSNERGGPSVRALCGIVCCSSSALPLDRWRTSRTGTYCKRCQTALRRAVREAEEGKQ